MKKTSNKKIRSVMEAMLKLASILFFCPKFTVQLLKGEVAQYVDYLL
jgi:hypothetical protein